MMQSVKISVIRITKILGQYWYILRMCGRVVSRKLIWINLIVTEAKRQRRIDQRQRPIGKR